MEWANIPKCVINLPHRTDRMDKFRHEALSMFTTSVHRIDGVSHTTPRIGIAQAHMNCISLAKTNGWPHVLIMEDDCVFRPGASVYFQECMNDLPIYWDVLLGGVYEGKPIPFNQHWNTIGEFCGLHFYIVHERAYNSLLAYSGPMHFDRFMNHTKSLSCYVAAKMFALQSDGYSDNARASVKYQQKLRHYTLL